MQDASKTKAQLIEELRQLRAEAAASTGRENEEALNRYKLLFDNISDLAYICDDRGNILFVNKIFEPLSGHKPEEIIGKPFAPLFDEQNLAIAMDAYQRTLQGESPAFELAFSDTGIQCEYHNSPVRDAAGNIIGAMGVARDVTERKAAEQALKESERAFSSLVTNLPGMVYRCLNDRNWTLEFVSSGCLELTGYPVADFTERRTVAYGKDVIHPADQDGVWNTTQAALDEKRSFTLTYRILTADGREKWVWEQGSGVFNADGELQALEGFIRDITGRKQTEDALLEAKEKFQALVESSSDWIWEVDENGVYTYASPKVRELLGYEPEEVVGKTPFHLMRPEEAERVGKLFGEIIRKQEPFSGLENHNLHRDGHPVVLETSGVPVFDQSGRFSGYRGIDRDITERKQAEQALQESEEKFRSLFDLASDGIFILDLEGNLIDFNRAAHERLGYTKAEMLAMHITEVDTPEASVKVPKRITELKQYGHVQFESIHRKKNGVPMPVEVSARIIDLTGKKVVLAIARDVSERKQAEEKLHHHQNQLEETIAERTRELVIARDQAEEADRAKSAFLANMSHELRTPLNAIIGFSEMMHEGVAGKLSAAQKQCTSDILDSGLHLLALINDILDLSKIEADSMPLEPAECSPRDIVAASIRMLRQKAYQHAIEITQDVAPELDVIVADERKIKQVLFNLISNAVKFTPDGGRIAVKVEAMDGDSVAFSVHDSGIGISREEMPRLFQPFTQLGPTITKTYEGSGLGLALSRKLVEMHGGRFRVTSEPGRGSTFTFTLPRIAVKRKPVVDTATHMLTWEYVLRHIGFIKDYHDREKLKFGLLHIAPDPDSPVADDATLAAALKKTIRQHEILGHGKQPGSYYAILMDADRERVQKALTRHRKAFEQQGLAAEFTALIYPDDGSDLELLLNRLESA
ncbi:MAG: PAS domain S-box protein [Mariprofundaceae bacterium]|nr:PAS domain S-box protein [Mariprofundaceae bacterium]